MQTENRFFEDLSKVATSALGTMAGVHREVEDQVRRKMREFAGGTEQIDRDEFDAVKASAAAAREDVEALRAEIAALRAAMAPADAAPAQEPHA